MGFRKHQFGHQFARMAASAVCIGITLSGCALLSPSAPSPNVTVLPAPSRTATAPHGTTTHSQPLPSENATHTRGEVIVEPAQRAMVVILPLKSAAFKEVASAVRAGIQAGAERAATPQLRWQVQVMQTDDSTQESADAFATAQTGAAVAVIGPLPRNAVNAALSVSVARPTVLLNLPPPGTTLQGPVLAFSLALDAQARFLADAAWLEAAPRVAAAANGQTRKPRALILQSGATSSSQALSRRTANGFAQQFVLKGGEVEFLEVSSATAARLPERIKPSSIDTLFMAVDAPLARVVRPFLPRELPVWGTSELNTGSVTERTELDGLRFADMPWLLKPDDLAVISYPRPVLAEEAMRWYAFGIDAFRLALELSEGKRNIDIDGVTGRLKVNANNGGVVERIPMLGIIKNGQATTDAALGMVQ